ncbi:MAG: NAD-glutamate dehydrogenase, partial [Caulobacterales bacterium]|nr:NAD-glutamate dehydrogenase [Caulobacterales bacterium]
HDDAVAEDLEDLSVADVASLAASFWRWAEIRPHARTNVRLQPGRRADGGELSRDILEIATVDKPFLVASVMGEINAQGVDVLAMFHPIVTVERDREGRRAQGGAPVCESMIQVHLEPLDETARSRLLAGVRSTLDDVDAAVGDVQDMRARMDQAVDELKSAPVSAPRDELEEVIAFLRWLRDDHFAFLGARVYEFATDAQGNLVRDEPIILDDTGRGVLRDPKRHVLRRGSEPAIITPAIHEFLCEPSPIIVAKSNMLSRVHRRVMADYIGVKRYRSDGQVVGETRFVGLFTSRAYQTPAREVPLIRRKVRRVLERADKAPESHKFKQLQNIVETYPRDELFQSDENELLEISLGILHLQDRPRPKLFIRRDRFDRFVSAFAFVPRERYDSRLRIQIGDMLARAYEGRMSAFYPSFSDGPLARVHFIIGLDPFNHPEPDPAEMERRITELARTWEEDLLRLARRDAPMALRPRIRRYLGAFSAGYREAFTPGEALKDAAVIEGMEPDGGLGVRAFRRDGDPEDRLRIKLMRESADPIPLSEMMPAMEALGLNVVAEAGYRVLRRDVSEAAEETSLPTVWVHDFNARFDDGALDLGRSAPALERAAPALWGGRGETDGFNRLILTLGVSWRDVAFLRACAKYSLQSKLDTSRLAQEQALAEHPDIVGHLFNLARVRFDPNFPGDMAARREAQEAVDADIREALEGVERLDHDRVLRRMWRIIRATVRTNLHQRTLDGEPKPAIALKIASRELAELAEPKPYREVFVWSPDVEGVHIRFGPVARGGLRWSDRREDFRTEVLGLVKAQVVKNAVIVPVGAKGGFYPKRLPRGGAREAVQAAGVEAYKTFVSALLDVTDNLVDGAVAPPQDVVRWDEDDPYLVVAADKGTAAFSDIANAISGERRFWLGDAFASGGSAGYDHKKMGITARGGWEAVKRHFREIGKDIQNEPFTVIGVGDMSGDVFGNGMLLSKHIRLLAAFDHRDIFIDPNPGDVEASWTERQRLFDLPRSTWRDYDRSLISAGGGVFSRAAKAVPLSPEIRTLTGLNGDSATPSELMKALLAAPAELLWFGGIGAYVKS